MIDVKNDGTSNVVEVTISGHIQADDIGSAESTVDEIIKTHGKIHVLLNLINFEGWKDVSAAKTHFSFIKKHHKYLERVAVVSEKKWQHWLVALVGVFIGAEEKFFSEAEVDEAKRWIAA